MCIYNDIFIKYWCRYGITATNFDFVAILVLIPDSIIYVYR